MPAKSGLVARWSPEQNSYYFFGILNQIFSTTSLLATHDLYCTAVCTAPAYDSSVDSQQLKAIELRTDQLSHVNDPRGTLLEESLTRGQHRNRKHRDTTKHDQWTNETRENLYYTGGSSTHLVVCLG